MNLISCQNGDLLGCLTSINNGFLIQKKVIFRKIILFCNRQKFLTLIIKSPVIRSLLETVFPIIFEV